MILKGKTNDPNIDTKVKWPYKRGIKGKTVEREQRTEIDWKYRQLFDMVNNTFFKA